MELLVSLPLLVSMMLITANYGLLLNTREALDSATRDAARLLMRAPSDCVADANATGMLPVPYPHFISEAETLIADRMGVDVADVQLGVRDQPVQVYNVTGSEALAGESYYAVVVTGTVQMDRFALLETFIGDTALTAAETGRWYAGTVPGAVSCTKAEVDSGVCDLSRKSSCDPV
ncbi:MAG: TadE/TadG family type IV pilus assembly protein [Pseudomonadota bacterium]